MKYLDLTGLQHFFDNVKSRLLPTVKGENGTVLKSTETGYEWGKVIDDSNATSTTTTLSANGITQALDTLDQTVNGYIDDLEQKVNSKTSINDSATETTTTWSSSKINTELSSKADSDTVSTLQTTVESKANQTELDSLETTVENIRQVPTGGETGQFLRQDNTWADVPTGSWDQLLTNVTLTPGGWSEDYAITPTQFPFGVGDIVDIAANLDVNEYNGEKNLSIKIKDVRLHGVHQDKLIVGRQYYEKYLRGEALEQKIREYIRPQREDIALLYRYLRQWKQFPFGYDMLWCRLPKLNYCKMRICIDVMQELGIVEVTQGEHAAHPVLSVPAKVSKTQLEQSRILRRLSDD